ncbi:MAG TPA: transcriptional repressor LexA [Gemmataceae bacterium]|nr:transcriptional repressor LexA [Gemmataceae bacterium]
MPDFSQLTDRQREIYEFIADKIEGRGYGPTVREIGEGFGIRSPNGVMCHLKALEKKGLIKREGFQARAIQLTEPRSHGADLPLLGIVAAGSPTQAVAQHERLELKDLFGDPNHYALQVRGRSMIENHIDDGDYVIIRKQETAENGDRVVAMIDEEVTLKRYYREKNHIRLEPANGTMSPILVDDTEDVKILGKLVGVMRRC